MPLTIFRCTRIDTQWALLDSDKAIICHFDTYPLIVGSAIPHIVTDVVLLCIPVPIIWNLHLHSSRKVILTAIFALGILYSAPCLVSSTSALPALEIGLAFVADECSESSVTVVSIVRLTYLIESLPLEFSSFWDSGRWCIWTSVEANVSIICGQYMTAFSVRSCPEKKSANITAFAITSSMPSLSWTHTTIHLHETHAAT